MAQAITKALKLKTPMHRGTIYKMIAGTRDIRTDELAPIANYIGEPIPLPLPVQSSVGEFITIPIEREVRPGIWVEDSVSGGVDLGSIVATRDDEFPLARHRAFLFRGDSMRQAGLLDGDTIICIEPETEEAVPGKIVVIERNRGGLVEVSARVLNSYKDRVEYADDVNPPIVRKTTERRTKNDSESIKVVAVVRRITRNVK